MNNKRIIIVDYDLGNLYSLYKALDCYANNVHISEDPDDILSADGVIIPGVGTFAAGMRGLKNKKLINALIDFAASGKPLMGICLGAQLLLSKGFEFGEHDGLGIISGKVQPFPEKVSMLEKIPHIGWNSMSPPKMVQWDNTIFAGINDQENIYFVHSFIMLPEKSEDILSLTEYGGLKFCAAIKSGNIYGVQFHPEKSGKVGLAIIKNFINSI